VQAAFSKELSSWRGVLTALRSMDFKQAVTRLLSLLRSAIYTSRLQTFKAALTGGPVGLPGQYGAVSSRVCPRSLHPLWNQWMEMRLEGGELDEETGEYDNKHAPYTWLRIEMWDRDRLSRDDFIGEVMVRLCPLMDMRVHSYELLLTDPEGKCGADDGVQGTIRFELQYES